MLLKQLGGAYNRLYTIFHGEPFVNLPPPNSYCVLFDVEVSVPLGHLLLQCPELHKHLPRSSPGLSSKALLATRPEEPDTHTGPLKIPVKLISNLLDLLLQAPARLVAELSVCAQQSIGMGQQYCP